MKRSFLIAMVACALLALPAHAAFDFYQGCTATAAGSNTTDVQAVAAATDLRLMGFSCRENAGSPAAAEFIIRNGTTASDPAVAFVKLAASESVREYFGSEGLKCPAGIYIDRVSGTSDVTVYSKP